MRGVSVYFSFGLWIFEAGQGSTRLWIRICTLKDSTEGTDLSLPDSSSKNRQEKPSADPGIISIFLKKIAGEPLRPRDAVFLSSRRTTDTSASMLSSFSAALIFFRSSFSDRQDSERQQSTFSISSGLFRLEGRGVLMKRFPAYNFSGKAAGPAHCFFKRRINNRTIRNDPGTILLVRYYRFNYTFGPFQGPSYRC